MSAINDSEGMPRAVWTGDLESLQKLQSQLKVRGAQGEYVEDCLEVAKSVTEHVARRLGGTAAKGDYVIGLATLTESQDLLLKKARQLQPEQQRLY